jgi:hypothetical protein
MPIPCESCPASIGARDWGANADEALQDCDSQVCSTFAVDNIGGSGKDSSPACGMRGLPVAKRKQEDDMAKIDLDALNIEELAALRDRAIEKLAEKVAARQIELEAEMERLSQYGKSAKKAPASGPVAKPRKKEEKNEQESEEKKREGIEGTEPNSEAA